MRLAAELADNACVFPSAPGADRAAVPRAVAEGLVQARYLVITPVAEGLAQSRYLVITPVAEGLVQAAPRLALLTAMALLSYVCYTTQYLLWLLLTMALTVQAALRLGSTDNVTVLVVWLVWEG